MPEAASSIIQALAEKVERQLTPLLGSTSLPWPVQDRDVASLTQAREQHAVQYIHRSYLQQRWLMGPNCES